MAKKITKCRGHEVVRQVRSAHPESCFQPSSEGAEPRWAVFGMSSCARRLVRDRTSRYRRSKSIKQRALQLTLARAHPQTDNARVIEARMTQKATVGTRLHRTSATMKENSGVSWPHWRAAPRVPNQTGPAWSVWGAVITARDQRVTLPGATAMCSPPCAPTQHVRSIRARTDNSPASEDRI